MVRYPGVAKGLYVASPTGLFALTNVLNNFVFPVSSLQYTMIWKDDCNL